MKKILFILLAFMVVSCTKNFEDMNINTKSPETVDGVTLFSNAERNLADQIASINVNRNVYNLWAQYLTQTTYTDESNYDVVNRTIPDNAFRTFYRDVLMDFKEADKIINATEFLPTETAVKANQLAIIEVLNVYTWQRLVDEYGNIPYSEALDIDNTVPKYDAAIDIYKSLFTRIDAAIAKLDANAGSFGSADLLYGGDVSLWITFANSLKLKLGMSVIDVAAISTEVKAAIEGAATAGVMTSNADNANFVYLSATPNTNPMYVDLVASGRHDYVACNTACDHLNPLNDPRLKYFYTTIDTGDGPRFIGGIYAENSAYNNYSHPGAALEDPTLPGVLIDYAEVEFYLAEAASKGFTVGGTAESHYNAGIEASILSWGGTSAEAATYIAQPTVAWATATGTDLQKIALQAWTAAFNRGMLGWTTWRRLDYPTLNPPVGSTNADIPVRMIYPINEQTLNKANRAAAAAAIGGDLLSTKLFWDIH